MKTTNAQKELFLKLGNRRWLLLKIEIQGIALFDGSCIGSPVFSEMSLNELVGEFGF